VKVEEKKEIDSKIDAIAAKMASLIKYTKQKATKKLVLSPFTDLGNLFLSVFIRVYLWFKNVCVNPFASL